MRKPARGRRSARLLLAGLVLVVAGLARIDLPSRQPAALPVARSPTPVEPDALFETYLRATDAARWSARLRDLLAPGWERSRPGLRAALKLLERPPLQAGDPALVELRGLLRRAIGGELDPVTAASIGPELIAAWRAGCDADLSRAEGRVRWAASLEVERQRRLRRARRRLAPAVPVATPAHSAGPISLSAPVQAGTYLPT